MTMSPNMCYLCPRSTQVLRERDLALLALRYRTAGWRWSVEVRYGGRSPPLRRATEREASTYCETSSPPGRCAGVKGRCGLAGSPTLSVAVPPKGCGTRAAASNWVGYRGCLYSWSSGLCEGTCLSAHSRCEHRLFDHSSPERSRSVFRPRYGLSHSILLASPQYPHSLVMSPPESFPVCHHRLIANSPLPI